MQEYFYNLYQREMFNPRLIGLFMNPFFIIRRGLYKYIKRNAHELSGKLLDFGCGRKPYRSLFQVEEYIGLDIEESGHSHKNEQIDIFYDGKHIPFEDEYFDAVFSSEVFEHVFELDNTLKEINRVCKVNGKLLITVPFAWDEHEVPFDFGRYSSYGIKYVLEKSGFKVLKQYKTTGYVETIFQMWNAYITQHILVNKWIRVLLTPILVMPFTILGIILSGILPKSQDYFHNNVVLSVKVTNL